MNKIFDKRKNKQIIEKQEVDCDISFIIEKEEDKFKKILSKNSRFSEKMHKKTKKIIESTLSEENSYANTIENKEEFSIFFLLIFDNIYFK